MDGVNFFKSNWATIRANAAMFTGLNFYYFFKKMFHQLTINFWIGFLLGNLPRESRKAINVDHLCSGNTLQPFFLFCYIHSS